MSLDVTKEVVLIQSGRPVPYGAVLMKARITDSSDEDSLHVNTLFRQNKIPFLLKSQGLSNSLVLRHWLTHILSCLLRTRIGMEYVKTGET